MIEWVDRFTVNGAPGSNQGVHVFRLRWGKVVALAVHCDTEKLRRYLQEKAAGGLAEAAALPITSPSDPAPTQAG